MHDVFVTTNIIDILNIIGVIVFAISGAFKGINYNLDILGVVVLGIITALGGGIIRDILMNTTPAALINERDMYYAIVAAIITYIIGSKVKDYASVIKIFDAAGLAVFTVIGAEKGVSGHLGILGIIIMGTLTGVAGGVVRDLLVREIPFVLKEEIYAMFCISGAFLYWVLSASGIEKSLVIWFVIGLIFLGRLLAVKFDLHLPKRKV